MLEQGLCSPALACVGFLYDPLSAFRIAKEVFLNFKHSGNNLKAQGCVTPTVKSWLPEK